MNLTYYILGAVVVVGAVFVFAGEGLMLRIAYGKPVFTDVSLEAVSKAETALRQADIRCTVQTIKSRNSLFQGGDINAYRRINMAYSPERDHVGYVYNIYVRRYLKEDAGRILGSI